jgi:two-component system response regulator FixJ
VASELPVYVIDDEDAMRDSLAFLLETSGFQPRLFDSASAFLDAASSLTEGCIVTDVRMPGMNGMELARHLRETGNRLPIVMITGHGDVPLAVEAMKSGVADFLEKPFDDAALLHAIRTATQGTREAAADDPFRKLLEQLSPREVEVLRGVVEGKANKVIAYDLGISPRTVEVYRANVMTKTGAASLAELVRMALRAGFA